MAQPPIIVAVDDKTDAWGSKILSTIKQPVEVKAGRKSNVVQAEASLRDLAEFQEQSLKAQVRNNSMAAALQAAGLI